MNTVTQVVPVIVGGVVTIIAAVAQAIVTVKHSNNIAATIQAQQPQEVPKSEQ